MDRDYLSGLVDLLHEMQAAKQKGEDAVTATYAKLDRHAGSLDRLHKHLHECRNELKANVEMDETIAWLAGERRLGIRRICPAIWEHMVQASVLAELERWRDTEPESGTGLPRLCKPMTTDNLAEIFECSESTMLRRLKAGKIIAKKAGRRWRVQLDQLPAEYVQKYLPG